MSNKRLTHGWRIVGTRNRKANYLRSAIERSDRKLIGHRLASTEVLGGAIGYRVGVIAVAGEYEAT